MAFITVSRKPKGSQAAGQRRRSVLLKEKCSSCFLGGKLISQSIKDLKSDRRRSSAVQARLLRSGAQINKEERSTL